MFRFQFAVTSINLPQAMWN